MQPLASGTRVPEWNVADRLLKARVSAGLEQIELHQLTGMSRATISAAENGHRMPTKGNLNLWALATGVPVEWLMTGKYTPRDSNPEPTDFGSVIVGPWAAAA